MEEDVYQQLLSQLKTDRSRLNARYRQAIARALARWFSQGRIAPIENQNIDEVIPRARKEHQRLQSELKQLCYHEPQLWLRSAACEALIYM